MKEFSWGLNFRGFLSMIQNKISIQTDHRADAILLQSNQPQSNQIHNHEHILTPNCVPRALKAKGPRAFPLPGRPPEVLGQGRTCSPPHCQEPPEPGWPCYVCLEGQAGHRHCLGAKLSFEIISMTRLYPVLTEGFFPPILPTDDTSAEDTNLSVLCLGRGPCLRVLGYWGKTLQSALSKSVCFNSRLNALKSPTYVFSEKMAKQ